MMEKNVLNTVIYVSSLNSLYSPRYTQKKSTLNGKKILTEKLIFFDFAVTKWK